MPPPQGKRKQTADTGFLDLNLKLYDSHQTVRLGHRRRLQTQSLNLHLGEKENSSQFHKTAHPVLDFGDSVNLIIDNITIILAKLL